MPALAVGSFALYPLISLVLLPEGLRSSWARWIALFLIGAAIGVALAIARWTPGWIRGTAMLGAGFAGIAVTGGVVAKRLSSGIGMRELAGILFAAASVTLVVTGWRRSLHGIRGCGCASRWVSSVLS